MYHLLAYDKNKQNTSLRSQGFTVDDEAVWNTNYDYSKSGYAIRKEFFGHVTGSNGDFHYYGPNDGNIVFTAPVMTDFSSCNKPMIPNVGGRLELTRASKEFYLMEIKSNTPIPTPNEERVDDGGQVPLEEGEDGPPAVATREFSAIGAKIKIKGLNLYVLVKEMNPSLNLKIEDHLAKSALIYHTTRMELRKHLLPANQQTFSIRDVKTSETSPEKIFFVIVKDENMNGKNGENPFIFANGVFSSDWPDQNRPGAMLENMRFMINNQSLESYETFDAGPTLHRKYRELAEVLGFDRKSAESLPFTPREYEVDHFIVGYDLTKAKNSSLLNRQVKGQPIEGSFLLELKFSAPLPKQAWLLSLSEFRSAVVVDKNRNVRYRYLE